MFTKKQLLGWKVIIVMTLAALLVPYLAAQAILVTAPPRTIQSGDVTTDTILDGTIINADISGTASIDSFKISAGTTGGELLFTSFGRLGTTTVLNYATTTGRLGVGTTTPGKRLSIHGDALVSGDLAAASITATGTLTAASLSLTGGATSTNVAVSSHASTSALTVSNALTAQSATVAGLTTTGSLSVTGGATTTNLASTAHASTSSLTVSNTATVQALVATVSASTSALRIDTTASTTNLVVTGTTALNGVTYTWPAADGANGQALVTSGAGVLSFGASATWSKCGEKWAAAATSTIDVTVANRAEYRIMIDIAGYSAADNPRFKVNVDSGPNYGAQSYKAYVAETTVNANTQMPLENGGDAATAQKWWIDANNSSTTPKFFRWTGLRAAATADNAPTVYSGAGVWDNSTTSISSFNLQTGGGTMNAGTRMTVLCTNN